MKITLSGIINTLIMWLSRLTHIVLFLFLFSGISWSQNTPAANGNRPIKERTQKSDFEKSSEEHETVQRSVSKQVKPYRTGKTIKNKNYKSIIDWGVFWKVAIMILGFFIMLGFIVPFFFFSVLGWWVILIAIGAIILGTGVMLLGSLISLGKHDLTPIIPIAFGVIAFFAWLLGVLILGIIELVK